MRNSLQYLASRAAVVARAVADALTVNAENSNEGATSPYEEFNPKRCPSLAEMFPGLAGNGKNKGG